MPDAARATIKSPHILITGATGFLGKVVLEEVLRRNRSATVTLLIRRKRSADAARRLESLCSSPCFSLLEGDWRDRLHVVEGDLAESGCGLDDGDLAALRERVTHAIHCAASIEFELPIQEAIQANVVATLNLMNLLRELPRLQSAVSVSTAYVTPHSEGKPVHERLSPLPVDPDEILRAVRAESVDEQQLLAESGHPNTYTLTKCVAEHLISRHYSDLPVTIVRPSIISACLEHPFPGWIDSRAAFAAFVTMVGTGNLRSLLGHADTRADIVPCDVVSAFILDALFAGDGRAVGAPVGAGERPAAHVRADARARPSVEVQDGAATRVPIRHATAGLDRCMTIEVARDGITRFFAAYPVDKPPYLFYLGPQHFWFRLGRLLEHNGRTWRASGQRAKKRAHMLRRETRQLNRSFRYFTLNTFDFRRSVPWPAEAFDPNSYIWTVCEGVYRHLLRRNRRRLALGGRRGGGPKPPRRPSLRRPVLSYRTLRAIARFDRALGRHLAWLTIDELSLSQLRATLSPATLMVLHPVLCADDACLGPDAAALLAAYAVLVRSHTGCGAVWLLPEEARPVLMSGANRAAERTDGTTGEGEGCGCRTGPLVVVAREQSPATPARTVLGTPSSLTAEIESGRSLVTVPVFIDCRGGKGCSDDRPPIVPVGEATAEASGVRFFERLAKAGLPDDVSDRHIHLHFGFTGAAEYQERQRTSARPVRSAPPGSAEAELSSSGSRDE